MILSLWQDVKFYNEKQVRVQGSKFQLVQWSMTTKTASEPVVPSTGLTDHWFILWEMSGLFSGHTRDKHVIISVEQ